MARIKLSICISTYNRGDLIAETLDSIIRQMTDEVELIVLDGGSTDNTPAAVKPFAEQYPRVQYIQKADAGGFDEKYCLLGQLAVGEYCWMFADDDIVKPGAVDAILTELEKDYSLIVINAEVRSKDLSVLLQEKRVNQPADKIYASTRKDLDDLLADTCMYTTYIGAIIIKRAIWNSREQKKYFGTLFVHVAILYQAPMPGKCLLMAFPWIVIRYGNALWTSRSFELWMFKFPEMVWAFTDYSDAAKQKVEAREPWRLLHRLLMARAMGQYSLAEYNKWLRSRFHGGTERALGHAIAATPILPLNLAARFATKWVFRKSPSITLYDLERWHRELRFRKPAETAK